MAFIRLKKIKGKEYAYLVENRWECSRARQSVKGYLGRVACPDKTLEVEAGITGESYANALKQLIKTELLRHGFTGEDNLLKQGDIIINLEENQFFRENKSIVLKLNEGFLCSHTTRVLMQFIPGENREKTGLSLATALVEAGLKVSPEQFVALFRLAMPEEQESKPAEFYY